MAQMDMIIKKKCVEWKLSAVLMNLPKSYMGTYIMLSIEGIGKVISTDWKSAIGGGTR